MEAWAKRLLATMQKPLRGMRPREQLVTTPPAVQLEQ